MLSRTLWTLCVSFDPKWFQMTFLHDCFFCSGEKHKCLTVGTCSCDLVCICLTVNCCTPCVHVFNCVCVFVCVCVCASVMCVSNLLTITKNWAFSKMRMSSAIEPLRIAT